MLSTLDSLQALIYCLEWRFNRLQALQTCQALPILINSQQPTGNSQQETANRKQPQAITITSPRNSPKTALHLGHDLPYKPHSKKRLTALSGLENAFFEWGLTLCGIALYLSNIPRRSNCHSGRF